MFKEYPYNGGVLATGKESPGKRFAMIGSGV
jgi:hypothetical protein